MAHLKVKRGDKEQVLSVVGGICAAPVYVGFVPLGETCLS